MGAERDGVRRPLTPARKLAVELLHHARQVPSLPVARDFRLKPLVEARQIARPAPSWVAIFMKAYGLTAARHPALRRSYVPWPTAHLYEHPHSVGTVLVEREVGGEPVVLAAKLRAPEIQPLTALDEALQRFRDAPVESVSAFRQLLRIGRLPWLLRRLVFWQTLNTSGAAKAKRFGTFMLSSLGNLGVEQLHPLTPLTTYFTFGPIKSDGRMTAKVVYDHRVLDGRTAGRALVDLEAILLDEIRPEVLEPREALPACA